MDRNRERKEERKNERKQEREKEGDKRDILLNIWKKLWKSIIYIPPSNDKKRKYRKYKIQNTSTNAIKQIFIQM